MKKSIYYNFFCLLIVSLTYGQKNNETIETVLETATFTDMQNIPYPDECSKYIEQSNELKTCTSDYISKYVNDNFDNKIISNLKPGDYKTYVQFKIDKTGHPIYVKARGNNYDLEMEAIRIIKQIPEMNPGIIDDRNVNVLYGLPINIVIPRKAIKKRK